MIKAEQTNTIVILTVNWVRDKRAARIEWIREKEDEGWIESTTLKAGQFSDISMIRFQTSSTSAISAHISSFFAVLSFDSPTLRYPMSCCSRGNCWNSADFNEINWLLITWTQWKMRISHFRQCLFYSHIYFLINVFFFGSKEKRNQTLPSSFSVGISCVSLNAEMKEKNYIFSFFFHSQLVLFCYFAFHWPQFIELAFCFLPLSLFIRSLGRPNIVQFG